MKRMQGDRGLSLFKPQTFTIQSVAPHIEDTVVSCTEVFERCSRRELDELLFRKVPAQLSIELIIDVRRGISHGVGHAQ